MVNKKLSEHTDLLFKEQNDDSLEKQKKSHEYTTAGISSLYGRINDNITFHYQGAHVHGYWERMWAWVWRDFWVALIGLLRIFISRK